jgi:5-methylcytosine-specific restriction endonuclease McrA
MDAVKAYRRAAYQVDREKVLEAAKAYGAANKERKREYDRAYRLKNAEKLAALKEAWRASNEDLLRAIKATYKTKRRAAELAGDSSKVVASWLKRVQKLCLWCGKACEGDFHIDHFYPLALGGEHRVANLAIACPTCNVRKNALEPEVFCRRMGFDFAAILERHRCDVGMLDSPHQSPQNMSQI